MSNNAKFCFLLVALLCISLPEAVADMPPERVSAEAQSIAQTYMSPYCPGRTIAACPSDDARRLRSQIEQWLHSGLDGDEIERRLIANYGEQVRGAPKMYGVGLLSVVLPVLFVLVGVLLVVQTIKRTKNRVREPSFFEKPEKSLPVSAEFVEQLDLEIQTRMSK